MKKTTDTNTSTDKVTKRVPSKVLLEFFNTQIMRQVPVTESFINRLAKEMVEYYVTHSDAYTIQRFLITRGIIKKTYQEWCFKFSKLAAAHSQVKDILADRLTTGWVDKKFENQACKTLIPIHDEEVRSTMEWQAAKATGPQDFTFNINEPQVIEQPNE